MAKLQVKELLSSNPSLCSPTWRFMGSYKYGYKSLIMGFNYRYLTYNPTYNYPMNLQAESCERYPRI